VSFKGSMEIPKSIQRMNDRIGASLGRNPHGEPLYKWVHSEDFWHWMRDISGYDEVFHPFDPVEDKQTVAAHEVAMAEYRAAELAWDYDRDENGPVCPVLKRNGIVTMEPIYKRRKMMPHYTDVWLIAHWHESESEANWRIKYGADALWPREGYWTPVNAWAEQGQLPTETMTDKFIELVKIRRAMTSADLAKEGQDIQDRIDRHREAVQDDIIADAVPAFGAIPGSRDCGVSFPKPGVDYAVTGAA